MKVWLSRIALGIAILLLVVTTYNASWTADPPPGVLRLIAHRGVAQLYDRAAVGPDGCAATHIEPPVHDYLEDTIPSIRAAWRNGADMVAIDVAPTADGHLVVFPDRTLECRTGLKGEVRNMTLAELQLLDPGHNHSADGGKTFPLRGLQRGAIPSLKQVLYYFPGLPLLYNLSGTDPAEADLLARELAAAGRDPVKSGDGFYGGDVPIQRIRKLYPKAWAWSTAGAERCSWDYVKFGWTGVVPASCKNGVILIPLNRQWAFWGWPNRLMQRMNAAGAKVIVTGRHGGDSGLVLPEQLGDVPMVFKGYIWVEDIWTVGPALRPNRDKRRQTEINAAEAGLERRRKSE